MSELLAVARRASVLLVASALVGVGLGGTRNPAAASFADKIAWVRRGQQQAYGPTTGGQVFVADSDGTNATAITSDASVEYGAPVISSDGSRIAFPGHSLKKSSGSGSQIFVANIDGTNLTAVTPQTHSFDTSPVFSPNGARIAFVRSRQLNFSDAASQVMVVNVDGTGEVRVTPQTRGEDQSPEWSPDSARIAFDRWHPKQGIYLVNSDGTHLQRLTSTSPGGNGFDWSRDGQRIVYSDDGETITALTIAGHAVQKIHPGTNPRWSPDGTKIAFEAADTAHDQRDAWVMNADGSGAQALISPACCPVWSPDGQALASSGASPGNAIAVVNASGGDPQLVTSPPTGSVDEAPAW
jgi:Tol biopolymer transport system component